MTDYYISPTGSGTKTGAGIRNASTLGQLDTLLDKAKAKGVNLYIPTDAVIADNFANDANKKESKINEIPEGWMGLDIGKETIAKYNDVIAGSKTILWNGPMGVFEMSSFEAGTKAAADSIVKATSHHAFSLIGGGDSVAAINKYNLADKVSYVSTGGGALLEYIEQGTLPGVKAIEE